jgi:Synergist-CTERM protein sorting domain-containing protein
LLSSADIMTRPYGFQRLPGKAAASANTRLHTVLGALAMFTACGLDASEPDTGEAISAVTVSSYVTTTCSTASVIGLSRQIADEVGCMSPNSLVRFAVGSGITITSNAVLPYLAANAKADLMAVGNVQINSAFRTVAQQYLLLSWFNLGRCGITAAAAVGRSNHESGRAVDLANYSSRITAMANHHWAHDVSGDPVHFDHLSSADIRGKDTLAFQRLWNRNHPTDKIAEDGAYGPQTEARLRQSPATGFAIGPSCGARARGADVVAIDGPDRIAPGARAHYRITVANTTSADWPETTRLLVAGGASQLYDPASWTSSTELGALGAAVPAGAQGVVELDVVAPSVATATPVSTELALTDGTTQVGSVMLAVTVTPDGDEGLSGDADDQTDGVEVSGGCATGSGVGWLAIAPVLLVIRRRRR